jgi:geranylgeranyl diphosphate synthase type II
MACSLYTDQIAHAFKPAIAVEIFHNFTLLHDDIMDNSVLRRNRPTVHEKWNRNIALLSGDVMSILSYRFIADCSPELLPDVLQLFTNTAIEVCEGQQYDMNFENMSYISTEDYLRMIELKTAVLIAASMGIGALAGKASTLQTGQCYQFGKNIGMAFQIRDDYLDVYGDPEVFGKMIGQDILSNKKTYLLTRSLELAKGSIREELLGWLTAVKYDPEEKINAIRSIYNQLDIERLTASAMNEYYTDAIMHLDKLEVREDKKLELRKMADEILVRHH